jgi:endo-1,4-beta-mannosidase
MFLLFEVGHITSQYPNKQTMVIKTQRVFIIDNKDRD